MKQAMLPRDKKMENYRLSIKRKLCVGHESIYNKEAWISNLWDYSDAYILVLSGNIVVLAHNNSTLAAFKNYATFTDCITKMDETTVDEAEGLDLIKLMHKFIEYSWSYFDATGSLWFDSKDEAIHFDADIANHNAFRFFQI